MVRVRIAPSPTGEPHIGNMRTAVFNWLFAKNKGGKFIVRIEDTDQERYVSGSKTMMLDALAWMGLDWDEGPLVGGPYEPYIQSERTGLYQKYAQELVEKEAAYYCFCSKERLEEMRWEQQKKGEPSCYDRRCRDIPLDEAKKRIAAGESGVVRLKVPLGGKTKWNDLIHGEIEFENSVIDDQILLKSDGFPTYHLAVVIDDHLMKISHILRADEWVPSTPKQILLYNAFGWEAPRFGHLPLVLGPNRAKLSKRHGETSVLTFRDEGYLPEAVLNFSVLLGWAYDDKTEIFSREELIKKFSLEKINPANPILDRTKLDWMNGVYIRRLSLEELADHIINYGKLVTGKGNQKWEFFVQDKTGKRDKLAWDRFKQVIKLVQKRMKKLSEFWELTDFFFEEPKVDPKILVQKDRTEGGTAAVLKSINNQLSAISNSNWKAGQLEKVCRNFARENSAWTTKDLFMTLRIALTGRTVSPPLFETMEVLGRQNSLSRLSKATKLAS